jgi:hypothetical protein
MKYLELSNKDDYFDSSLSIKNQINQSGNTNHDGIFKLPSKFDKNIELTENKSSKKYDKMMGDDTKP